MTDNELLQALYISMQDMKEDITSIKDEIQDIKNGIQGIKDEIQDIKNDIQGIKGEMQGIKDDIQGIKGEMQAMKDDIQLMKTDIKELNVRVNSIEMTLENETNRNIKIIAEGHLDLSRKLDNALMVENEKELLMVRVNVLENDVRKIKEQFQIV